MERAVVWSSVLFNRSSIAEEARNLILALDEAGVPVHARPLRWPWETEISRWERERLDELIRIGAPDGFVHVMHADPPGYNRHPRAARHIGRTMRETERLPPRWVGKCNEVDEVWVPSEFNLATFADSGVEPRKLHKIPEALRTELYDPAVRPLDVPGASGFVFLSVIGWTRRKGWDVLVRAYVEEFSQDEDVTLVIKANPYFGKSVAEGAAELDAFMRERLGRDPAASAPIILLDIDPGGERMPRLYRAADAYVMPSRGEGWGRPYMEAMAMGLPTIGTRWGGSLEFMTDENSYLVDYELVDVSEEACAERPLLRGHRWAEPSVGHLREVMRRVIERSDEARAKGERARETIVSGYGWQPVARTIVERLEAIEGELPRLRLRRRLRPAQRIEPERPSPVVAYRSELDLDPSWYARIVAATCAFYPAAVYVEIGVDQGSSIAIVAPNCAEVHGVDPNPASQKAMPPGGRFWQMASDRFFAAYDGPPPHVVFIDGDHRYEQAARDFRNALRLLAPGGIVFLHDTWPTDADHFSPASCGTVCELLDDLRAMPELEVFTWPGYPGLTAVRRRDEARDAPRLEAS
ncbi:MAG: class I SAM-dependent methyltransferase [Gaiellaceae bacterium]|jgi:glycosyltransferase involved in cell wall biosynthesis